MYDSSLSSGLISSGINSPSNIIGRKIQYEDTVNIHTNRISPSMKNYPLLIEQKDRRRQSENDFQDNFGFQQKEKQVSNHENYSYFSNLFDKQKLFETQSPLITSHRNYKSDSFMPNQSESNSSQNFHTKQIQNLLFQKKSHSQIDQDIQNISKKLSPSREENVPIKQNRKQNSSSGITKPVSSNNLNSERASNVFIEQKEKTLISKPKNNQKSIQTGKNKIFSEHEALKHAEYQNGVPNGQINNLTINQRPKSQSYQQVLTNSSPQTSPRFNNFFQSPDKGNVHQKLSPNQQQKRIFIEEMNKLSPDQNEKRKKPSQKPINSNNNNNNQENGVIHDQDEQLKSSNKARNDLEIKSKSPKVQHIEQDNKAPQKVPMKKKVDEVVVNQKQTPSIDIATTDDQLNSGQVTSQTSQNTELRNFDLDKNGHEQPLSSPQFYKSKFYNQREKIKFSLTKDQTDEEKRERLNKLQLQEIIKINDNQIRKQNLLRFVNSRSPRSFKKLQNKFAWGANQQRIKKLNKKLKNNSPIDTKRGLIDPINRELQRQRMGIGFLNNLNEEVIKQLLDQEQMKIAEKFHLEQFEQVKNYFELKKKFGRSDEPSPQVIRKFMKDQKSKNQLQKLKSQEETQLMKDRKRLQLEILKDHSKQNLKSQLLSSKQLSQRQTVNELNSYRTTQLDNYFIKENHNFPENIMKVNQNNRSSPDARVKFNFIEQLENHDEKLFNQTYRPTVSQRDELGLEEAPIRNQGKNNKPKIENKPLDINKGDQFDLLNMQFKQMFYEGCNSPVGVTVEQGKPQKVNKRRIVSNTSDGFSNSKNQNQNSNSHNIIPSVGLFVDHPTQDAGKLKNQKHRDQFKNLESLEQISSQNVEDVDNQDSNNENINNRINQNYGNNIMPNNTDNGNNENEFEDGMDENEEDIENENDQIATDDNYILEKNRKSLSNDFKQEAEKYMGFVSVQERKMALRDQFQLLSQRLMKQKEMVTMKLEMEVPHLGQDQKEDQNDVEGIEQNGGNIDDQEGELQPDEEEEEEEKEKGQNGEKNNQDHDDYQEVVIEEQKSYENEMEEYYGQIDFRNDKESFNRMMQARNEEGRMEDTAQNQIPIEQNRVTPSAQLIALNEQIQENQIINQNLREGRTRFTKLEDDNTDQNQLNKSNNDNQVDQEFKFKKLNCFLYKEPEYDDNKYRQIQEYRQVFGDDIDYDDIKNMECFEQASIFIQKNWRGYRARQEIKEYIQYIMQNYDQIEREDGQIEFVPQIHENSLEEEDNDEFQIESLRNGKKSTPQLQESKRASDNFLIEESPVDFEDPQKNDYSENSKTNDLNRQKVLKKNENDDNTQKIANQYFIDQNVDQATHSPHQHSQSTGIINKQFIIYNEDQKEYQSEIDGSDPNNDHSEKFKQDGDTDQNDQNLKNSHHSKMNLQLSQIASQSQKYHPHNTLDSLQNSSGNFPKSAPAYVSEVISNPNHLVNNKSPEKGDNKHNNNFLINQTPTVNSIHQSSSLGGPSLKDPLSKNSSTNNFRKDSVQSGITALSQDISQEIQQDLTPLSSSRAPQIKEDNNSQLSANSSQKNKGQIQLENLTNMKLNMKNQLEPNQEAAGEQQMGRKNPETGVISQNVGNNNNTLQLREINSSQRSLVTIQDFSQRNQSKSKQNQFDLSNSQNQSNTSQNRKNSQQSEDKIQNPPSSIGEDGQGSNERGDASQAEKIKLHQTLELATIYQQELSKVQEEQIQQWNEIITQINNLQQNESNLSQKALSFISNLQKQSEINRKVLLENLEVNQLLSQQTSNDAEGSSLNFKSNESNNEQEKDTSSKSNSTKNKQIQPPTEKAHTQNPISGNSSNSNDEKRTQNTSVNKEEKKTQQETLSQINLINFNKFTHQPVSANLKENKQEEKEKLQNIPLGSLETPKNYNQQVNDPNAMISSKKTNTSQSSSSSPIHHGQNSSQKDNIMHLLVEHAPSWNNSNSMNNSLDSIKRITNSGQWNGQTKNSLKIDTEQIEDEYLITSSRSSVYPGHHDDGIRPLVTTNSMFSPSSQNQIQGKNKNNSVVPSIGSNNRYQQNQSSPIFIESSHYTAHPLFNNSNSSRDHDDYDRARMGIGSHDENRDHLAIAEALSQSLDSSSNGSVNFGMNSPKFIQINNPNIKYDPNKQTQILFGFDKPGQQREAMNIGNVNTDQKNLNYYNQNKDSNNINILGNEHNSSELSESADSMGEEKIGALLSEQKLTRFLSKKQKMQAIIQLREKALEERHSSQLMMMKKMLDSNKVSPKSYYKNKGDLQRFIKLQKEKLLVAKTEIEKGWQLFDDIYKNTQKDLQILEKMKSYQGKVLNSQGSEQGNSNPESLQWFQKFFSNKNDSDHSEAENLLQDGFQNNTPSGSAVYSNRNNDSDLSKNLNSNSINSNINNNNSNFQKNPQDSIHNSSHHVPQEIRESWDQNLAITHSDQNSLGEERDNSLNFQMQKYQNSEQVQPMFYHISKEPKNNSDSQQIYLSIDYENFTKNEPVIDKQVEQSQTHPLLNPILNFFQISQNNYTNNSNKVLTLSFNNKNNFGKENTSTEELEMQEKQINHITEQVLNLLTQELGRELENLGYTAVTANSVNNTESDVGVSKQMETYNSETEPNAQEQIFDCMTLNNIKQFLVYLSQFVRDNYLEEFLLTINTPLGLNDFQFLKTFNIHQKIDTNNSDTDISTSPIYPLVKYLNTQKSIISQEIFSEFYDQYREKYKMIPPEFAILQYYQFQMILDTFNQSLDHMRPFGIRGQPVPWKVNHEKIAVIYTTPQNVEKIFGISIARVLQWGSFLCGFIPQRVQAGDGEQINLDQEYLNQIKQDRLAQMLENEVVENEAKWLDYQAQETDVALELANEVFNFLVHETAHLLFQNLPQEKLMLLKQQEEKDQENLLEFKNQLFNDKTQIQINASFGGSSKQETQPYQVTKIQGYKPQEQKQQSDEQIQTQQESAEDQLKSQRNQNEDQAIESASPQSESSGSNGQNKRDYQNTQNEDEEEEEDQEDEGEVNPDDSNDICMICRKRLSQYITTCCKQSICEICGFTVQQCPLCQGQEENQDAEQEIDEPEERDHEYQRQVRNRINEDMKEEDTQVDQFEKKLSPSKVRNYDNGNQYYNNQGAYDNYGSYDNENQDYVQTGYVDDEYEAQLQRFQKLKNKKNNTSF